MKVRQFIGQRILSPCALEMFDHQVDPYIGCEHHCLYCYTLNDHDVREKGEIITYKNIEERLHEDISQIEPQIVYIGMNTDPYQPCERLHQQTRRILNLLSKHHFSASILTKSDLIIRDIDLLTNMLEPSAGVSIAFADEITRKLFEPDAPPIDTRVRTLEKLKDSGIETYTLITPVMPFITDVKKIIEMVEPYSDSIWLYPLEVKSESDRNWQNIKKILENDYPELTKKYLEIIFSANHHYWIMLRKELAHIKNKSRIHYNQECLFS